MVRTKLKLVASQPPEALLAHRLAEARDAYLALLAAPYQPKRWFTWLRALDRVEAERIRYLKSR